MSLAIENARQEAIIALHELITAACRAVPASSSGPETTVLFGVVIAAKRALAELGA